MSDRDRGTGHGLAWNRIKSVSIHCAAALALLIASAAPSAAGDGGGFRGDPPLANQSVPADGLIDFPPQFIDEPEAAANAEAPPPAKHHAPQEAAGLGTPAKGFDPRNTDAGGAVGGAGHAAALFDTRGSEMLQVFGALAVVLSLLFLTRFILSRASGAAGGARPSGVVEILARYPVARGQQLILLKLARRILLIHQNGSAMTTLSEIVDENEVAALLGRIEAGTAKKDGASFKAMFSRFSREHDSAMNRPFDGGDQGEVIDLTRKPFTLGSLFSRKGVPR